MGLYYILQIKSGIGTARHFSGERRHDFHQICKLFMTQKDQKLPLYSILILSSNEHLKFRPMKCLTQNHAGRCKTKTRTSVSSTTVFYLLPYILFSIFTILWRIIETGKHFNSNGLVIVILCSMDAAWDTAFCSLKLSKPLFAVAFFCKAVWKPSSSKSFPGFEDSH